MNESSKPPNRGADRHEPDVLDFILATHPEIAWEVERTKEERAFGLELARARVYSGQTRESLAEALRVDRSTIAQLESGGWPDLPYRLVEEYLAFCGYPRSKADRP